MPSLQPKTLYVGANGAANVYTVSNSSSSNYTIIKNINFTNSSTGNVSLTAHILAPSATAGNTNVYLKNITLLANETVAIDTTLILSNGYSLYLNHNGNITTVVSGVEYS